MFQLPKNNKKTQVLGAKMGHFWPQNESKVSETVFIFVSLKSWWSMLSFIHIGHWKNREITSISSKLAKNAVLGAKMGHFWSWNESEVSETGFIFVNLKRWWSMKSFIHIGYWKNREIPSIISKWAKNAVLGAKVGHFWAQNESEVSEPFFYLRQP